MMRDGVMRDDLSRITLHASGKCLLLQVGIGINDFVQ